MEKQEMLWVTSKYVTRSYSQEQMRDGDDCYELIGEEGRAIKEGIVEYMGEMQDIGRIPFYEQYREYNLY